MIRPCLHKFCSAQSNSTTPRRPNRWALTVGFVIAFTLFVLPANHSVVADEPMTPFQRAVSTPKGMLKSPYRNPASVAEAVLKIYRSLDCKGCHGGGAGEAWPLRLQIQFGFTARTTTPVSVDRTRHRISQPRRCVSETRLYAQRLRSCCRSDAAFRSHHKER